MNKRILWADDEIDLLRAHILFLQQKGFDVEAVTNGEDAIAMVQKEQFDVVFLDEQMPGLDGLATLARIKRLEPMLPVVMITKSEEEDIMEDAIGAKISDYLIKPVHPNQILLTIKRLLERNRLTSEHTSQTYLRNFNRISQQIMGQTDWQEWIDIYKQLTQWSLELEQAEESLQQVLRDQYRQANYEFGRFIHQRYKHWLTEPREDRPMLSPDILSESVLPLLSEKRPTVFIVIDCMRYDQWLGFEKILSGLFSIETRFHYSILPTATPYARNAIFSGLYPLEIEQSFPDLWQEHEDNETSLNRFEEPLLNNFLQRMKKPMKVKYEKVIHNEDGKKVVERMHSYLQHPLSAFVFNFVDTLVHSRSDSDVLKEIAPDEPAFRSLTQTWFVHSPLLQFLKQLAEQDVRVVITTDHGSVRALRDTKVFGDRETSTSLRYKVGKNLKCDEDATLFVAKPSEYKLPRNKGGVNYLIAKEDYYFIYPTNYHKYQNKYNDTFQHGGASMEEMILPIATLTPRKQ